jgi:hypothetical protein
MELFGTKFCVTLGAWKLRFVLMLEDGEEAASQGQSRVQPPHHVHVVHNASHAR